MKKIFLSMLAIVGMIATSCENTTEIDNTANGQVVDVTVNVGTPQIVNRSFSDGATATHLQYAVYNEAGDLLVDLTETAGEIHGETTVTLQLVTGNKYSVIFWAAAPNAPYTVDFASKTMTVSYAGATCGDEARDAFYCCQPIEVTGAMTVDAELKRPFAQINVGTNDYQAAEDAGYVATHARISTEAYTTLNFVDGTVENLVDVDFAYASVPTAETFPVAGYEYMAMAYVLTANTMETVDVEFASSYPI